MPSRRPSSEGSSSCRPDTRPRPYSTGPAFAGLLGGPTAGLLKHGSYDDRSASWLPLWTPPLLFACAFDDVEDISAVRYNSLEGATGRAGKRGAHELPQIVPGRARPKAASLADRSFIEGKTRDQRNRGRRTRGLPAEADPAAGAALCRAQALAADRAAGDGRRWQGRHRQPRLRRLQRSGHDGDWLQAAHTARARPRLPLA